MKKKIALFFLCLASGILLAHSVVPHHHHGARICFFSCSCCCDDQEKPDACSLQEVVIDQIKLRSEELPVELQLWFAFNDFRVDIELTEQPFPQFISEPKFDELCDWVQAQGLRAPPII